MVEESFIHLLNGYLEDRLDKDDLKRFFEMLEASPEKRDLLAQSSVINRLIGALKQKPVSAEQIIMALPRHGDTAKLIIDHLRESGAIPPQDGKAKAVQPKRGPAAGHPANGRNLRTGKPAAKETPGILYFFRVATAVAACLLISVGVWKYSHRESATPAPALAMLDSRGNVAIKRGNQSATAPASAPLYNGDVVLVGPEAMAIVRYSDEGTFLKLQEWTILTIEARNGAKNFALQHGTVAASVAPQPAGLPMTLTTPQAVMTVLGTKFSLRTMDVSTALDVTSGKVRVTRGTDRTSVDVSAGNRVEVNDTSALLVQPAQNTILGHISEKQISEMFQTMTTAKAGGINTFTYDIMSDLPANLRSAIATAHKGNVRFFARVDVPKDVASNYDDFANRVKNRLSQFVLAYNFDGVYVTRPRELADNDLFRRIVTDVCIAVNNTGVAVETGVQREISTNESWFTGY